MGRVPSSFTTKNPARKAGAPGVSVDPAIEPETLLEKVVLSLESLTDTVPAENVLALDVALLVKNANVPPPD